MFVGMSVLGTVFKGYFFAFHLLNIVNNNQLLRGVIQAVTQNGNWVFQWRWLMDMLLMDCFLASVTEFTIVLFFGNWWNVAIYAAVNYGSYVMIWQNIICLFWNCFQGNFEYVFRKIVGLGCYSWSHHLLHLRTCQLCNDA